MGRRFKQDAVRLPGRPLAETGDALEPRLPYDVTRLNDHELMRLFNSYVRVLQWAGVQHAKSAVEAAEYRRQEKIMRAKKFLVAGGNRETRSAEVETNPQVIEVGMKAGVAESMREILYALKEGYLEGKAVISRELTRRVELERGHGGSSGDVSMKRRSR